MNARETWKQFSAYYDSYVRGFTADLSLYQHACAAHERILEVGCGSGRVLQHLLGMGHPVTGVDISEEMLQRARIRLEPYLTKGLLKLLNHDFQTGPLQGSFTLGLVTYFTFNYVLDRPEQFLKHLYQTIFVHGTIMFDLMYPKTRRSPDIDGQWIKDSLLHEGKSIMVMEKRTWLAKKGIEERVQVFDDGQANPHEVVTHRRYYSPGQMAELLLSAGFKDIEFCRGYDGLWVDQLDDSNLAANFVVQAHR